MPALHLELPCPARSRASFFGDPAHARFINRPTARTKLHATIARVVGIAAIVLALIHVRYDPTIGLVMLAMAVVLASRCRCKRRARSKSLVPYAALSELTTTEGSGWLSVAYRGRPITSLHIPSEGELARAVPRELRGLVPPRP